MPRNRCSLITILWRTMACFFRCFGARDVDRRHLVSSSNSAHPTVQPVVSRNVKLSSLFHAEERDDAVVRERDNLVRRAVKSEFDDWELKDEARFLKACGTLQETPAELRKFSKKYKDPAEHDSELKFHSSMINTPSKLHEKAKQSGQSLLDEETTKEPSAMHSSSPSSCVVNGQSDVRVSISSSEDGAVDSAIPTVNLHANENRSVRFEDQPASPQSCIRNGERSGLKGDASLLNSSPYPTPLHLNDDLQTPGTVYASGSYGRVKSQYVYASMDLSETTVHSSMTPGQSLDAQQNNANSIPETSPRRRITQEDPAVGTDLASWLKPPASREADNERKYRPGRVQGDRPILGLVAEHWKEEEEDLRISPKPWDGKGIPNSTTKYKEDQKVRWHATPFEERLEKALSEDTVISQRKTVINEAVVYEDDEERDTASCKLQSLKASKSLVSC